MTVRTTERNGGMTSGILRTVARLFLALVALAVATGLYLVFH